MRICYFIQAHKNPDQVYRLVRLLKSSSSSSVVIIGYDFTNSSFDMSPLVGVSDVYLIKGEYKIIRGDISILQPYFSAIQWLFENTIDFDWLVYMSGECYPVKQINEIEDFLYQTKFDGFIQFFDVLSSSSPWKRQGHARYFSQRLWRLPHQFNLFLAIIAKLVNLTHLNYSFFTLDRHGGPGIYIRARKTPFSSDFACYGGNHRHTLSRKCIEYMMDFLDENPDFFRYYCRTLIPEESMIQTILANNRDLNLVNDYKVYDEYPSNNGGHPKNLTCDDFEKMTNGQFFFARKFKENANVLDLIDREVHNLMDNSLSIP